MPGRILQWEKRTGDREAVIGREAEPGQFVEQGFLRSI
jgi:hypothetical protein